MESSWVGINYEEYFHDIIKIVKNLESDCIICREKNYIHQTKHDGICGYQNLFWITVENNSFSSCIYHDITTMWYFIKLLYYNKPIDDIDSHTPYFYVFVWTYCFMPEEVSNTLLILSLMGDPDIILETKQT